jgi:predicted secreted protein
MISIKDVMYYGMECIVAFSMVFVVLMFMLLPVGVKKAENLVAGQDAGAPDNAGLKKKFIIGALVSLGFTALYLFLKYSGQFDGLLEAN